mmetsp:Transcript_12371/g.49578  ORF Transcript_12371/g.49578 Transcript_12371/m.49578 type:complete len:238 (-) Transcript_12371:1750-2463(-)
MDGPASPRAYEGPLFPAQQGNSPRGCPRQFRQDCRRLRDLLPAVDPRLHRPDNGAPLVCARDACASTSGAEYPLRRPGRGGHWCWRRPGPHLRAALCSTRREGRRERPGRGREGRRGLDGWSAPGRGRCAGDQGLRRRGSRQLRFGGVWGAYHQDGHGCMGPRRHCHLQRWNPPRRQLRQDDGPRLGHHQPRAHEGNVLGRPRCLAHHARTKLRPHHRHDVCSRPLRQPRPNELLCS